MKQIYITEEAFELLSKLSKKRKEERAVVRFQTDIASDLIVKAAKKEFKK